MKSVKRAEGQQQSRLFHRSDLLKLDAGSQPGGMKKRNMELHLRCDVFYVVVLPDTHD